MISQRLLDILLDSFGKILIPGLTMTIPLTAISFAFALVIAVATALVQFAHVRVPGSSSPTGTWAPRSATWGRKCPPKT